MAYCINCALHNEGLCAAEICADVQKFVQFLTFYFVTRYLLSLCLFKQQPCCISGLPS